MNGPNELELDKPRQRVGLPSWLARKKPMNPKLMVVSGHATKEEIEVRLPMSIGREQGQNLVISHPLVSRRHCEIARRDDYLTIKDFGSANGTYVNDKRVKREAILRPGDKLTIGPLTFVVIYNRGGRVSSRQAAKSLADRVRKKARGSDSDIPESVTISPKEEPEKTEEKAPAAKGKKPGRPKRPKVKQPPKPEPPPAAAKEPPPQESLLPEDDFPALEDEGSSADEQQLEAFLNQAQKAVQAKDEGKAVEEDLGADPESVLAEDVEDEGSAASDLLEADMHSRSKEEHPGGVAGKTLLADSIETASRLLDVTVALRQSRHVEEEDSESISSLNQEVPSLEEEQDDEVLAFLLGRMDRLQQLILEHYQEAAITTQLVSRLQQDQLDVIREEMDQLYTLTRIIREQSERRHPLVKSKLKTSREQQEDDQEDVEQPRMIVEDMQSWLLKQMAEIRNHNQQRWEKIREFLESHGVDSSHI